jgi:hypothetical protein
VTWAKEFEAFFTARLEALAEHLDRQTRILTCPRCGGTRSAVAVVLRSSTAQSIVEHLKLSSRPLPLAPVTCAGTRRSPIEIIKLAAAKSRFPAPVLTPLE